MLETSQHLLFHDQMRISCISLSIYHAIELLLLIWSKFKVRNSIYFKALLCSTCGILLLAVNNYFGYYFQIYKLLYINPVAWTLMTAGFSGVLYSRLHLVCSHSVLKKFKYAIFSVVLFTQLPDHLFFYGHIFGKFKKEYILADKIHFVCLKILETMLGFAYIYFSESIFTGTNRRKFGGLLNSFILIQVSLFLFDAFVIMLLLVNEFMFLPEFKTVLYVVKLKLELLILERLETTLTLTTPSDVSLSSSP
jgi:hypothetical protein